MEKSAQNKKSKKTLSVGFKLNRYWTDCISFLYNKMAKQINRFTSKNETVIPNLKKEVTLNWLEISNGKRTYIGLRQLKINVKKAKPPKII